MFCPIERRTFSSSDHLDTHADRYRVDRLRAYVEAVYSRNMRGPLHRASVLALLRDAAQVSRDEMEKVVENIFAVVGVALCETSTAAMPLYDMQTVFLRCNVSRYIEPHLFK